MQHLSAAPPSKLMAQSVCFQKYMLPVTWEPLNTAAFPANRVNSIKSGDLQAAENCPTAQSPLVRAHFRGNLPAAVPGEL